MSDIRYKIIYLPKVIKNQLPSITKSMRERILKAVGEKLSSNPLEFGKPLKGDLKNHRRLRIGDYRVIYKVDQDIITVLIIEIDHRKDVYE
jgi:mRNA interferase RelE/StbE